MKPQIITYIPEIFVLTGLILSLIILTILFQRKYTPSTKNSTRVYTPDLNTVAWYLCFILSFFYLILQLNTESTYFFTFGIYSTHLIHTFRVILTLIFLLFLIYLKTDLKNFTFYSFEFLIVMVFLFLTLSNLLTCNSFLNIFIFIEIYSLGVYYLVAAQRVDKSIEASIKYFVFGSTTSIFLVFGFFLIYYSTGIGNMVDLELFSYNNPVLEGSIIYNIGCALVAFSILAKIGGGFFFFLIVDVYEGASYPLLIFLNLFGKVVYIFVLFALLQSFNIFILSLLIKILLLVSLVVGAYGALVQVKVKRFLIYTSIYNISFFSIPFWHFDHFFKGIFLFFVFVYLLNTLIYTILFVSIKDWNSNMTIRNISELSNIKYQNKPLAVIFSLFSFATAGLPPASIFFSKLIIFIELPRIFSIFWLVLFLVITVISFFYYIRLIRLILHPTKQFTLFLKPLPDLIIYLVLFTVLFNIFLIFFFDFLFLLFVVVI